MNLYIDIETIPAQGDYKDSIVVEHPAQMKKPETISDWENGAGKYAGEKEKAIDEVYRKTALSGTHGEILCISWAFNDESPQCVGRELELGSEKGLIEEFFSALFERKYAIDGRPESFVWIGHFISGFDLRFIWQRCVINGVKPKVSIPYDVKPWDTSIYDTKIEWTGMGGKGGKLDEIAKAMGHQGKGDIDGSKVWDYVLASRYEEVFDYCKEDVEMTRMLHKRMTFSKPLNDEPF